MRNGKCKKFSEKIEIFGIFLLGVRASFITVCFILRYKKLKTLKILLTIFDDIIA